MGFPRLCPGFQAAETNFGTIPRTQRSLRAGTARNSQWTEEKSVHWLEIASVATSDN
jgi:hypothetical protein